jgi:(p)ppGpp synthase/HD superfamily hydrolase
MSDTVAAARDPVVTRAERIARAAHAGQVDKVGNDYILHVERVAGMVDGDEAKAVAWLHDVVEDTPVTMADLRAEGFSKDILTALRLLTRTADEVSYAHYIEDIRDSGNPLAIAVKLGDLRDHLDPNCPDRLRPRYVKAIEVLTS